jgi:nucleotide-binding universal stress UspA family protein
MKYILVPIGSNKNAVSNLQYAIDLAQELDAYVYVISVFQELSKVGGLSKVNTIMKEDSENILKDVLSKVDKKDVTVISHPIKGAIVESVERFNKHVPVDLMVLSPRSNSIREEVYLGKMSGRLVKNTNISALVVPEGAVFKAPKTILMAFKNGTIEDKRALKLLRKFASKFETKINLLHVKTPDSTTEMKKVSSMLEKLKNNYTTTENATTFQAILEYFQTNSPDMLCVVRRNRGFFSKLWEKNVVLKKDFHTSKPLLILTAQ